MFRGTEKEDPYLHVREFEEICGTIKYQQLSDEIVKLKLFPFLLKDKAKSWFNSLKPESITTWNQMSVTFLQQFFPNQKTASIRHAINTFSQKEGEPLWMYLERYNDLLLQCPHHGIEMGRQVQILYEGFDCNTRTMLESLCNGDFTEKSEVDAWVFRSHSPKVPAIGTQ